MKISNSLIAVDLGSNSFHMVMASEQAGCIQLLYTQKQRVALGAGLSEQNLLSEEAMQRGLDCLARFGRSFARDGERTVRVVATHTLRKAINAQEFIDRAYRVFPYPIEIISGRSEAELIYQGVVNTFALRGKTLVVDIGGGSTEFIVGSGFDALWLESLEFGSGSVMNRCFADGHVNKKAIDKARAFVFEAIAPYVEAIVEHQWLDAVGTSGSIKMMANIMAELFEDRTINLLRLDVLAKKLVKWGHWQQFELSCVDARRAPQLAGVVAILLEVFERLAIKSMEFCSGSLREGVLYNIADTTQMFDPRHRTITNMANMHMVDDEYSRRVVQQLEGLFEQLAKRQWFFTPYEQVCLTRAALLHEIGLTINFKKRQIHGAYIIENAVMPGFDVAEQRVLAELVRNHRGKVHPFLEELAINPNRFGPMVQVLRLAIILTQGRNDDPPWQLEIYFEQSDFVVEVDVELMQEQVLMDMLYDEVSVQTKGGLTLKLVLKG